ncbi:RIN4 pathogenic type III effector avirulence factor Avr cleavage site [Arabidopsis suecica]|uniref:RIN4 pathogenic type III effector avirulence factor Avr cleavage site n=1 Tax=Arabidopsis suecica TaxID=45249 RepID=A0A8T2B751_ARASU|nr:RIN4 pathogenic type III effector avirulence factor Avr cleavage site [Arabidopsis suecica]
MANRPHVPKFGDWNNQDQPFTVVFDNARTNKRQDLYESIEKPETKPQEQAPPPPQPARRNQRPEPPKPVKEDTPRAPPPAEKNRVRAPPADQLYGGGGSGGAGRSGSGSGGGLYGGYGGGSVGNQRQPPAPRPAQPRQNLRGGNNGRGGTTIPPFPGSLGAGENMSYTHIFDKVKEERNEGVRPYGGTAGNTPSRPINSQHDQSPKQTSSSMFCCFAWCRKGSKY